jgi:hypothetical protein
MRAIEITKPPRGRPQIRTVTTFTTDRELTRAEIVYGLVIMSATGSNIATLPAATPSLAGCDVLVMATGNTSANIVSCAAGWGGLGAGFTNCQILRGKGDRFYCDGTSWYHIGAGTVS